MKNIILVSTFFSAFALITFSAPQAFGYGDAGCGLGSVIFKENKILSQTLASTTNATFANQFFGMTSGTSNCSAHGFVSVDKKEIHYAEANFQTLTMEMAQGNGETLKGFAQVLGCSSKSQSSFMKTMKEHYSDIFKSQSITPFEMLENVKNQLKSNTELAQECKTLA